MTMISGTGTPAKPGRTPWLRTAIAVIVVGLLVGIGSVVWFVSGAVPLVGEGMSAPVLTVPGEQSRTLDAAEYAVLEGTSSESQLGGVTVLTPSDVTVTGPDGAALTVRPTGVGTETFTRNGTVYTAFAYVTVPRAGEYRVAVTGAAGTQVVVSRSVSSAFGRMLPGIVSGAVAGLLVVVGLVLLLVALVRRSSRRTPVQQAPYVPGQVPQPPAWQPAMQPPAPQPAASSAPAPGWYPDPGRAGGLRWWDGERWTDQAR